MKKVSKFVLMLLTFAMIFSLLSCSNGDVSSPEPGAEQQESSAEQPEQPAEKPDDSQGEEVVAGEEPLNPTNFNEEISVPLLPVDTHGVKADKV